MKEYRYKVIFAGKIKPDCDVKIVKRNLINSLNINDGDVEKLFSGRRIVVQKNIDHKKALSIKEKPDNAEFFQT